MWQLVLSISVLYTRVFPEQQVPSLHVLLLWVRPVLLLALFAPLSNLIAWRSAVSLWGARFLHEIDVLHPSPVNPKSTCLLE
jgi:hypothetical protein